MKKLLFLLLFVPALLTAQQLDYAHKIINTLTSPKLQGRAYCTGADKLAAVYIVQELKKYNILPLVPGYLQPFTLRKNCITDSVFLYIDDQKLNLGNQYIIEGDAPTMAGSFYLYKLTNPKKWQRFARRKDRDSFFVVVDYRDIEKLKKNKNTIYKAILSNRMQAAGVIILKDNFYFYPRSQHRFFPLIYMKHSAFPLVAEKIWISVKAQEKQFSTQNILGYIKGQIDTILLITAHYDHLGRLGQVYFPGANDNASGTAMVMDIARHFASRKSMPYYTLAFALFSGEEMGLLGSTYFVQHPPIDLNKVKLVINLDMVGSGDQGITIVNGKDNPNIVSLIKQINQQNGYLPDIALRANAPNSDHYPFTQTGVNAIFIYTRGGYKEYHNIYDRADRLPLNKFAELENLLITFIHQYK